MFNKPEEIIMAVLALLWVAASWFLAALFAMPAHYVILITALNAVWIAAVFRLWQTERIYPLLPVAAALFTACWWPCLDGWAENSSYLHTDGTVWYATWTFKFTTAALVLIVGYIWKWRRYRKLKMQGLR